MTSFVGHFISRIRVPDIRAGLDKRIYAAALASSTEFRIPIHLVMSALHVGLACGEMRVSPEIVSLKFSL